MSNTKNKIIEILSQTFACEINEDSNTDNSPNWDSLNHVRMILELQQNFKIKINHNEIATLKSVKEIENFLTQKLQ